MIEPCGLTPGAVQSRLESAKYKFGKPWTAPKLLATHFVLFSPIGQELKRWMVIRLVKVRESVLGICEISFMLRIGGAPDMLDCNSTAPD